MSVTTDAAPRLVDVGAGPTDADVAAANLDPPKRGPGRPRGSKTKAKTSASDKAPTGANPPRGAGGRFAASSGRPTSAGLEKQLADKIAGLADLVGLLDEFDGQVLDKGGPKLARALDRSAAVNPRLKRVLERWVKGGTYGELVAASLAIALPIMAHHGMLPEEMAQLFRGLASATGDASRADDLAADVHAAWGASVAE